MLERWLSAKRGKRVKIRVPRRGQGQELVDMASKNASLILEEEVDATRRIRAGLAEVGQVLDLLGPPRVLEAYDASNIQGKQAVGAMVVFQDGRPAKGRYRRFRISGKDHPDDYSMMRQILSRRILRYLKEPTSKAWALPDLILVDGGRGHLSVAAQTLEHHGVDLPVVALAKENEEVFAIGKPDPVSLSPNGLALLQAARDEAHRVALGYHRTVRTHHGLGSVLDGIPGLGPKRKKALLERFGSVKRIALASLEELAHTQGMNSNVAKAVSEHLRGLTGSPLEE